MRERELEGHAAADAAVAGRRAGGVGALGGGGETVGRQLGSDGRVVVRSSGTEAKLRVMIEGEDEAQIEGLARQVVQAATAELGA